jgi:hypothetical protein
MNKKTGIAVSILSFAWLLTIIYLPASVYGCFVVTLLLSIFVFGQIERDKSKHERAFYFQGTPSESTLAWLRRLGNVEIFFRGLLLAVTSVFLFQGTQETRVYTNRASFLVCTVLAFFAILQLDRRTGLNALRWGYVKMSLIAGVIISIPIGRTEPIGLAKIAWKIMKFFYNGSAGISEVVEVVNSLAANLNGLIRWSIQLAVGDTLGSLISAALSTNVVYGFIVVLYASALHQGIKWVRSRFDTPQSAANSAMAKK